MAPAFPRVPGFSAKNAAVARYHKIVSAIGLHFAGNPRRRWIRTEEDRDKNLQTIAKRNSPAMFFLMQGAAFLRNRPIWRR
jgi:hypothetical protein